MPKYSVIVSYYAARDPLNLSRLIESLVKYPCDLSVVINADASTGPSSYTPGVKTILNNNLGMNIVAWNRGFFENLDSDFYIFLQDECYLRREDFLEHIFVRFDREQNLGIVS